MVVLLTLLISVAHAFDNRLFSVHQTASTPAMIVVGTYNGFTYMVTPGGCGYEPSGSSSTLPNASFTPTCSGTDFITKSWATGTASPSAAGGDPGITNANDGAGNTLALVTNYADTAAARYCHHLVLGGYTDWFLPARNELSFLYTNKALVTGHHASNYYWAGSDSNFSSQADSQRFSDGFATQTNRTTILNIRCVRKY